MIFGHELQTRDSTFVEDVVQARMLACATQSALGVEFSVGCGQRHSLPDLVAG